MRPAISWQGLWDQYAPSIVLQDHHRAALRRAGVVLAAAVVGLNVAIIVTAGLVAVWRHL